jgi:hypothetical protein
LFFSLPLGITAVVGAMGRVEVLDGSGGKLVSFLGFFAILLLFCSPLAMVGSSLNEGNVPGGVRPLRVVPRGAGGSVGHPARRHARACNARGRKHRFAGLTLHTCDALPGMVARHSGLIISIGSVASTCPNPGGNGDGATNT